MASWVKSSSKFFFKFVLIILLFVNNTKLVSPQNLNLVPRSSINSHFCPKLVPKIMKIVVKPLQQKTVKCVDLYKHTSSSFISLDDLRNLERTQNGQDQNSSFNSDVDRRKWIYDEERMLQVHGGDVGMRKYFERLERNSECFLVKKEVYKDVKVMENDEFNCCEGWSGENCDVDERPAAEKKNNIRTQRVIQVDSPKILLDSTSEKTDTNNNQIKSSLKPKTNQTLDRLRGMLNSAGIYIPTSIDSKIIPYSKIISTSISRGSSTSEQFLNYQNQPYSICQTWLGHFYLTFDNRYYMFEQNNCWYVMAKSGVESSIVNKPARSENKISRSSHENSDIEKNSEISFWSLSIQNFKNSDDTNSDSNHKTINFQLILDDTVFMVKNQEWFMNGNRLKIGTVRTFEVNINVLESSSKIYFLECPFLNLAIKWSDDFLQLYLPDSYHSDSQNAQNSNIHGLCGNYNSNPLDDIIDSNVVKFATENKINGIENKPCFDLVKNYRSVRDLKNNNDCQAKSNKICGILKNMPGFKICDGFLSHLPFYNSCQETICSSKNSKQNEKSCQIISNYAQICMNAGMANLTNWRDTIPECQKTCSPGKIFDECVYTNCQPTCLDIGDNIIDPNKLNSYVQNSPYCGRSLKQEFTGNSGSIPTELPSTRKDYYNLCSPKCRCLSGYIEAEDGRCIRPDGCPCQFQNRNYKHGETITQHCSLCTCKSGKWDCEEKMCTGECQIISGQHVRTFDSLRYSINYGALTNNLNNDESNKCLEYIAFSSPKLDFELIFQLDNVYSGNIVKLKLIDKSTIYSIEKVQNFPHLTVNHSISERIPYRSADIFIETASSKSVTIKHFGKSILWIHDENSIYVDVEPVFRGKTFGLCGTFDFRESNEFKTLNGDVESSVEAFVRRFVNLRSSACRRIQQNSPTKFAIISRKKEQESKKIPIKESKNLITKSYATNPCTLFPQKIYFAKSLCNAIKTSKVFKNCSIDIVNQHVEMCEFGACQSDQPTTLCSIAANLARVCGKDASSWRLQTGFRTICQPKCPEGMIFEECINLSDKSGAKTCTQLWTTNKYFKSKIASKITGDDKNKNGLNHGHIHELADLSRVENTCIPGCKCSNSLVLDDIGNNYNDLNSFSRNYICIPKTACPCLSPDNIDDTRIVSAGSVLKRGCIICTCYYGKFNCNSDRCGTQITCPNNLMYSEDIMACEPKTCKSLRTVQAFSKSYCENAPSYAGCTCPEGKVLLEESIPGQETDKSLQAPRCVTKNECPCYHNGKIYPSGAVISKGCSECTCVGVNWNCIENKCNAKCSTYGTPHYTTFDGNDYEFSGPCSYILARSNFGSFSITVENVPCGVSGLACTKSVYFNIGHMSIHLLRGKQVTVNNIPIKLPKKYGFLPSKDLNLVQNIGKKKRKNSQMTYKNIADIEIRRVGSLRTIINVNSLGLTLIWDGRTSVSIYAKPKLVKQLSGLCGYYDNRRENDFLSRQGVVESTAASFARSWRVNQKCDANMTRTNYYRNIYFAQQDEMKNRNLGYSSGMENSLAPIYHDSFNEMARYQITSDLNNCQYSPQRLPWARDKCSILYSEIFKSCHKIVPPDHFYKRCVNDGCSCSSGGDCECICTAISAYANECAENGFSVKWRSNELCPIQCDGKLEYYACGSLCEATCDDLHAENRDEYCKLTCIEGCFCPPGYVRLNDEKCVRPKQCPCKLQGAEFLPGTILEKNCQNCTCIAGRFNCIGTPCNEEHVCQNQLTEFYCQDNSTCIPFAWKCDGVSDCPNELDEKDCGPNPNDPDADTGNGGTGMFPNYTCREPNLEFKCHSQNHCIPKTFVCDGQIDCNDGSDEKNCVDTFQCKDNEFTCKKNGRCIRNNFVCDGQFDCGIGDKSDEEECDYYNQGDDEESEDIDQNHAKNPDGTCKTPYFQCRTSGLCIPRNLRCDGNTFDCDDNSDEYNCHCPPGSHYECYDGLCLIRSKVCDKFMDCGQGEEEMHCDYDQKPGKPDRTPSKEPVTPATTIPFGKPTIFCLENDKNCQVTCHKQHFTCRDKKKCLPKIWVCDGQEDCYDGSDELACKPKCQLDTFACDNSTTCLNMQLVCDGHLHCLDKSDESELVCGRPRPQPCQADWFRCQDHICLPSNRVCDGIYDCSNGEDESDCGGTSNNPFAPDKNNNILFNCPEYTCLNGKCLNYNQVCNGRNECSDSNLFNNDDQQLTSSDEIACGQYSDWTDWSTCSESCGSGVQMRKRTCNIDHNGVNYDADSMTYYELLTHGIDPLRIKCPGVSRQMRPCTAKTCFGQWTIWSSWTQCSDKCVNEYRSRYSKCSLNHCQKEQEFDKESGREIVYIGERDKIEIEECDLSKCAEQPGIETEQTCQAKNMQFFRQKPFVTTCRDLSFLYTELNKTTLFSDIQEIINLAELRFPKNLSRPPGCYCPTGELLTDNNQCTDFNQCSCLSPSSGQSYDHDQEISSTDGCEVCTCKGGLTTDCIKKKDCQGACRWTEWTAFGSCLGACGSNGIQWSFRNPVDAETAENSNCVGIFQKSRRCMTKPCPFCIDETGYDEDNNESQENLVERLHKYGDQWTPVDKKNYPCHICTCLTNGTIACSKYCNLKNIGCPSGQELIVPDNDFSDDKNSCCYCYDPNAPKPTDSPFDGLLTTIKNYFFPASTTDNSMIKPTIIPDTEEINNCKNNGNLICDINNSDGSFKCLDQKLVCDNHTSIIL